jgi:adenylate cyclase
MDHFFLSEPIQLLLVDDRVEGLEELLVDLKADEIFEFLPVVLVLQDGAPAERRAAYARAGVEHFLEASCPAPEFLWACQVALRYKLKIDNATERWRLVTEENITRSIRLEILQKYVPQTVWDRSGALAHEQTFQLPEAEVDRAIVFADLQAFTTRAEGLSPTEVIHLLNRVFSVACRWVYAHGGDIDKFIGDAFFAVFEAPGPALDAAVAIQNELADLPSTGVIPLKLRIGVHWGRVVRGSVGGERRLDHTLIGDVVNTAQRLEANGPPGGILASRVALEASGRPLAPSVVYQTLNLKGRGQPLEAAPLVPGDPIFLQGPDST